MSDTGRGVVYVATGAAHVAAAQASAASVRQSNPGLAIALFSDAAGGHEAFDQIFPIANPHARSKVDCLTRTPFDHTLYLDGDTRVRGDLSDLFRLLERFDLAVAHRVRDPRRVRTTQIAPAAPGAFPEHNTGVVLYAATPRVLVFFAAWQAAFAQNTAPADQIAFRQALWQSELRVAVLPPRFNTRSWTWLDHWFSGRPPPVILHLNRFNPGKRGSRFTRRMKLLSGPHG